MIVIGRDDTCQVRLAESGVSDRHAAIERRDNGYFILDLDSANGVRVNGQAVHEQRLASGDEVELGSARLLFEIVHERPKDRFTFDPLQAAMAVVIAGSILGQIGLMVWILREPRRPDMPVDSSDQFTNVQAEVASAGSPLPQQPESPPVSAPVQAAAPVGPVSEAFAPNSLYRLIRILRVNRTDGTDGVSLTISARAQVRERSLDTSATAICVQYFVRDAAGRPVAGNPSWLTIPPWENFSTQTFAARFPGPAAQFAGFVVRTYYRRQLQDVFATAPQLAALAPNPMP
jgi:pSer/pThr/pTyr-binding forkhead associated (FHA) protein